MRVVDRVALAQGVQAVALAGMHLPRQRQGIEDSAEIGDFSYSVEPPELGIQEGDVERRIVNNEFRIAHELEKLRLDLRERRLIRQPVARQTVHLLRAFVDVALRIQIAMKGAPREPAIEEFDAADFDDAMLLLDFEAGGFRVENDLPHQ